MIHFMLYNLQNAVDFFNDMKEISCLVLSCVKNEHDSTRGWKCLDNNFGKVKAFASIAIISINQLTVGWKIWLTCAEALLMISFNFPHNETKCH